MTHLKCLCTCLILFFACHALQAQDQSLAHLFSKKTSPATLEELFMAQPAYGLKAGIGYVQDGDFSFCLGARYQVPVGEETANGKQFIAGVNLDYSLRTFSNETFSSNSNIVSLSPEFKRVCGFDEKVNMAAGVRLPIQLGRSSSEFDGLTTRSDNILGAGLLLDYDVAFALNDDSFIGVSTSIAGFNWTKRTNTDNPDVSTTDTGAWFGFNKNNSLRLSYNKILD